MASYETSIDIDAPVDIVFDHLVTPEGLLAWMGQHANLDASPGGAFEVDIDGSPVRGRFLEIDRPRRVVVSWGILGSDDLPPGASTVEFVLTANGPGTRLDLRHRNLPDERLAAHERGWQRFLGVLAARAGRSPASRRPADRSPASERRDEEMQ